ncbi:MAG TPA: 8-oxoguanine deaminase [Chloroflexota bacterium]|nr:8-oxoguanine deaminase [Chloroflexota bacterium]
MTSLLIRDAAYILTMDEDRRELVDTSIEVHDGWITNIGSETGAKEFDMVIDGSEMLVLPGFVNVHHHLYQNLTRGFPESEGRTLFPWLRMLYPVWSGLDEECIHVSTQVGLAELLLTGCTTSSDHLYVFPKGERHFIDVEVAAATEIGARFHATRGSMDLSVESGGLPPASVTQECDEILDDSERVVRQYNDPEPGALTRVAVAPCSPFSVTRRLMEESATLARRLGVRLHTHIAETLDEERYCEEAFGCPPIELLERMGWLGDDVWLAHCVHLADDDIQRLSSTRTAVAHCPTSNMLLGSGMARIVDLLRAEVAVGLGVDGSASNDSGYFPGEIKQSLLMARTRDGVDAMTARQALWLATRGGAAALGRDDIGHLCRGACADISMFRLDRIQYTGAERDPAGAFVLCGPARASHVFVHGRQVVRDGQLTSLQEDDLARRHRQASSRLLRRAGLS